MADARNCLRPLCCCFAWLCCCFYFFCFSIRNGIRNCCDLLLLLLLFGLNLLLLLLFSILFFFCSCARNCFCNGYGRNAYFLFRSVVVFVANAAATLNAVCKHFRIFLHFQLRTTTIESHLQKQIKAINTEKSMWIATIAITMPYFVWLCGINTFALLLLHCFCFCMLFLVVLFSIACAFTHIWLRQISCSNIS